MGNTRCGLGTRFLFICIFLVTMEYKCVGDGANLTTASCSEQERRALLKFKRSIQEDHGMLSSWGIGKDCCRWKRVGCDNATGRVVSLHLRRTVKEEYYLVDRYDYLLVEDYDRVYINDDQYLVVTRVNSCLMELVNPCLMELVNLKHLDLSGNDFRGSRIPEFIGSFKQLRYLNLSNAFFKGNIPHQIGNLSNLEILDLSSSSYDSQELMTNDIAWISSLSKLEHLDLGGLDLSFAQNLDSLLYMTPSLLKLSLSGCGLSMAHLGSHHLNSSREFPKIKHLDLSENGFRGQLPGLFLNMTSLVFLDLSNNDFSMAWSFENLLNTIPFVSKLRLSGCKLQNINHNANTNSSIQHLDLSGNELEGKFPYVLTNMSSLLSLDLSGNKLSSYIPNIPHILKLDISENNFQTVEDVGIWRHCHLKELIVSCNKIKGEMTGPSTNVSECSQHALEILYMDSNTITCSIPESLERFTNLRGLDLSFNKLTGSIPEALGKVKTLQVLYLSYNQLIGPIPKFHGQLTILHLAYNNLSGSIPESIGRLTTLTEIFLKSNHFKGPIPVSLGRLASLRVFSASSNVLNGTIPNSIGQLTRLYLLDVSNNSLEGVVSEDHFANLPMLKYLDANSNNLLFNISREWIPPFQLDVARLGSCKIVGGFPQWFRTQRKLVELVLYNASISGPLPRWLRLLPNMHVLDLSHNKLTGGLTNLHSIHGVRFGFTGILLLQDNLFKGLIPRWLCTRTDLQVLDISKNRLTGNIPRCLWDLPLDVMLLGSNRLSGVIPSPLYDSSLRWLQLNDNNLRGELSRDFGYFRDLIVLDLGENKISGNIPKWIGQNITSLNALRLHKNNFTGHIPHSLCKSQELQILDLAHNNLTGSIPHCFGELEGMKENSIYKVYFHELGYGNMMQVLKGSALYYTKTLELVINMDLSSNKLVGEIPEELTALDALVGFNLSNNHLSRGIPKNIGNMKSLNSLDLSSNKLSGMIPPSMAALHFLSYLNLSHNNLSGQIPTGNQLRTLTDPSIYADNAYLCGAPLPNECPHHEDTRSKNKYESGNEEKKICFYLDIMSGFATGFWGIIGVLVFKKQWRHKIFMFSEVTMDRIYVAVTVRVLKAKRRREAA